MASASHVMVEEDNMINSSPYKGKGGRALLKCSLETSFQCEKRRELKDPQPLAGRRAQVENESDDELSESDQWLEAVSKVDFSVNERLSALQHLLPDGLELEEDEVLRVAIEYVKQLEREIQMFDNSTSTHSHGMDDAPLQKRGLCIVPLSTLAKAL